MNPRILLALAAVYSIASPGIPALDAAGKSASASAPANPTWQVDEPIARYFENETRKLTDASLRNIQSAEDWNAKRDIYRRQLFEMLGLQPMPKRTPLKPVVTGKREHAEFTVENVHFQSRPGLYVTGNLYIPKTEAAAAAEASPYPAILYVCGHGRVKKDGISYGNKTHYQHHGAWFARNGYVCLTIDTLQLGEIEGIHHGTYREGRWWWNARGYTSAGVEAWNCIRALDYLETRPEVDAARMGVTGRSGGGAYSWWISALDERIAVSVPVAGITSLHNHVVDGAVEGHCDCMFHVNTYRWDFAQIAALVAPRPLLIANTDKDRIFPLDGVMDVYNKTRRIYRLLDAEDKIGIAIVEGPHSDTQPIRVPAFHWFERFLKGKKTTDTFEMAAVKFFEPEELKVFEELPGDEKNTTIDESFTATPKAFAVPETQEEWEAQRDKWMRALEAKCFRGWPRQAKPAASTGSAHFQKEGLMLERFEFESQDAIGLSLFLVKRDGIVPADLDLVVLNVLDESDWSDFLASLGAAFPEAFPDTALPPLDRERFFENWRMFENQAWAMAYVCPRGIGPSAWSDDPKKRTQIRRRFMLLGQTLDGMRAWDARRAIQTLRGLGGFSEVPLWLQAQGTMAGVALYASLFEPAIARLDLHGLPASHRDGPVFLNVLRFLDTPQAVAMAAERSQVRLYHDDEKPWAYPASTAKALGWDPKQFNIRGPVDSDRTDSAAHRKKQ